VQHAPVEIASVALANVNTVPHLSPTTLTADEQRLTLRATAGNVRVHVIYSLALGTGLRLAEGVGLDVGDVFAAGRGAAGPGTRSGGDRQGPPGGCPHPPGSGLVEAAGIEPASRLAAHERCPMLDLVDRSQ
jgi:hypothetical protein